MRIKSKVVRRRSIDQTLEAGVSVEAGTSVGSIDSAHDLNGSPVGSMVVQGSIHDGCLLDSGNGHWVGTLDVPSGLGSWLPVVSGYVRFF